MRLRTSLHRLPALARPTPRADAPLLRRAEAALLLGVLLLSLLAWWLPAAGLPQGYHHFADQRGWLGLPFAADVLSNLPFALMGAWGGLQLWRLRRGRLGAVQRGLAALFFIGLVLTAACSSLYHWAPHDPGLCIDRLGMSLAFAGLLGLAAADRIGHRAGLALAVFVGVAAPLSALLALWAGNMTPWALLQGGGLVLLAVLAMRRPLPDALGFSVLAVIAFYAVAKALELADAPLFDWTGGVLSGHSAKHLVAALAAWPVVRALQRRHAHRPAPGRAADPARAAVTMR
jgi:hypothetical protein